MLSRLCGTGMCQGLGAARTVGLWGAREGGLRAASGTGGRIRARLIKEKPTLWQRAMAPAGDGAFSIGKGAVAGASVVGMGALCFYGIGLSSKPGTLEISHFWPEHVKARIKDTYIYFGSSIAVSAASAMAIFRSPTIMNLVTRSGWMAMLGSLALMIGTGAVMRSIDYQPGFGNKQMAWLLHSGVIGAVLAPMCFMGGPILIKAAWYTAGIVGGLSTVAVCAPSGEFLQMGAPLAMGLGVVFASSVAGMFLPPTTALGAGLYSIALYGGLVVFGGLLVYDTQKIISHAENYPTYGYKPYDPVNAAMSIYLDTVNIFVRIATILSGGGGRRK